MTENLFEQTGLEMISSLVGGLLLNAPPAAIWYGIVFGIILGVSFAMAIMDICHIGLTIVVFGSGWVIAFLIFTLAGYLLVLLLMVVVFVVTSFITLFCGAIFTGVKENDM